MKRLLLVGLCLALAGCIQPALELHGGLAPKPEHVTGLEFAGMGATWNTGLIAARVPWQARIASDVLIAFSLREVCFGKNCQFFGRTVDSHITFSMGAFVPEFIRFATAKANRSHRCSYPGADGKPHDGWCRD